MTNKFSIKKVSILLIAAFSLSTLTVSASRADDASDAQSDCMSDALRLCGQFVPDRAKITACMVQKKMQLSPACRKHFH